MESASTYIHFIRCALCVIMCILLLECECECVCVLIYIYIYICIYICIYTPTDMVMRCLVAWWVACKASMGERGKKRGSPISLPNFGVQAVQGWEPRPRRVAPPASPRKASRGSERQREREARPLRARARAARGLQQIGREGRGAGALIRAGFAWLLRSRRTSAEVRVRAA